MKPRSGLFLASSPPILTLNSTNSLTELSLPPPTARRETSIKQKPFVQAHAHTKGCHLETEILLSIIVGNTLNQLFQQLLVVRELARFNPLTDHVA